MLNGNGNHRACAWADFDGDGYLDLFVTTQNQLYRNNGNGTFTVVANVPFVRAAHSSTCVWADYNQDGRPDLWASSSQLDSQNYLYRNDGNGVFTRITAAQAGGVVSIPGNCGVWGDYNNDGYPDIWISPPYGEVGQHLYRNNGDGTFTEVTAASRLTDQPTSLAGAWGDYDNDGYLDLFVANFHAAVNFLYHNNGDGTFTRVKSGSVVNDAAVYNHDLSCAWGDYDNDGFLDLMVGSAHVGHDDGTPFPPNFLYRNTGNSNAWLKVKCVGTVSNRAAIGAKVRVKAAIGGKTFWQLREISGGGGYGGQNLLAHFGLGEAQVIDLVRVEWPSGIVQEFPNVAVRQQFTVIEPSQIQLTSSGEVRVRGRKGVAYRVEATDDFRTWSALGTVTNATGVVSISDPEFGRRSQRFYRALEP